MAPLDVIYSDDALNDLQHIFDHIVASSGFVRVAGNYVDRIMVRYEGIGPAPHAGRPRPDFGSSIRQMPFESVIIIYAVRSDHVMIARIFNAAQDYEALMSETI